MSRRSCWTRAGLATRCGSSWSCLGTAGSDEHWAQSGPRELVRGRVEWHAGVPLINQTHCMAEGGQARIRCSTRP